MFGCVSARSLFSNSFEFDFRDLTQIFCKILIELHSHEDNGPLQCSREVGLRDLWVCLCYNHGHGDIMISRSRSREV